MSEMPKQTHDTQVQNTDRLSRRQKLLRRVAAPAALLALSAGAYEMSQYDEEVGTTKISIDTGETPVGAVSEGVSIITEQHDVDINKVSDIVFQGQDVSREIGESVQPGQEIEVTVVKNDFGKYKVEADPVSSDTAE